MNRFHEAIARGVVFQRTMGWRNFLTRLLRVWLWLPALLNGRKMGVPSPPVMAVTNEFGVNVIGYLTSEKGLGQAARGVVNALTAVQVPLALNNVPAPGARDREISESELSQNSPYRFNLFCINGGELPGVIAQKSKDLISGKYNIALWHWEMQEFPKYWLDSFRFLDEVWVPTRFVQDVVSKVSPTPVVRIPDAVPPLRYNSELVSPSDFGLRPDSFIFLSIFDFHGVLERKNPRGLIEAFKRAFGNRRDVALLLKCTNSSSFPRQRKELNEAASGLNVSIVDDILDRAQLDALYSLCDGFVLLHRGEGFGLTMAEAMLAEKPVIATRYGGNMDFMSAENSYLVDYELTEITQNQFPYEKGWLWAEPNIDHAAALMRRVLEKPDEALTKAKLARATISNEFSPAVIGRLMLERLQVLTGLDTTLAAD